MNEIEKKEMIEEMARVVSMNCGECDTCKFLGKATNKIDCIDFFAANELYEQGYRQCKDKVVLSREEYAKLKHTKILLKELQKDKKFYQNAALNNLKKIEKLENQLKQSSKETAREFVKALLQELELLGYDESYFCITAVKVVAKQFGVEEL